MRLLKNPPFTFGYTYAPSRQPHVRLVPGGDPELLYDTVRDNVVGPDAFTAEAWFVTERGWWVVCTGVGAGFGCLRFRTVPTEEEASGALVKWFYRRFRCIELDCDYDPTVPGVDIGDGESICRG